MFAINCQSVINDYQRYDNFLRSLNEINSNKYKLKFAEQEIMCKNYFGIQCKAIENKTKILYAIRKIAVTEEQKEIIIKRVVNFDRLYAKYVVNCYDYWFEENYFLGKSFKMKKKSILDSSHAIFNPNKTLLLHIQMELCYKTMSEIIEILNTELNHKKNEFSSPLGYYIACELFVELLECVNYLHKQNIIRDVLTPENILITYGRNGRFVKISDFYLETFDGFDKKSQSKCVASEKMYSMNDFKADINSLGFIAQDLFNIDINE
jgi:serine/threonine protein kinase